MGIVINSTTGEIDLDQTTPGTYVVTYTVQGLSSTQEVTVNAVDDATFSYSAASYLRTDPDPTPTITGLTGGTFSGTTGLVINSTTGEIDLSASTEGNHTITYNTSSSSSSVCPNTYTQTVEVDYGQMKFEVVIPEDDKTLAFSINARTYTGGPSGGRSYGWTVYWGDGNSFTQTATGSYVVGVSNTYQNAGTYTVSIDWEDAFNGTGGYFPLEFTAANKLKVTKWMKWGKYFRIGSYYRVFDSFTNMAYTATDYPIIWQQGGNLAGHNWNRTFAFNDSWNVPINLSDWNVSQWTDSSRYNNTFNSMFNLPELSLENDTVNNGSSINTFRDGGTTLDVGRDTTNGCKFKFNNVNIEGVGSNTIFGNKLFQGSYMHKESSFTNWTYDNSVASNGYGSIYAMFNSSKIKNLSDNENLTIDCSGWKDKNNTSLNLLVSLFGSSAFVKDGLTNVTGTLTIDFTSPYGIDLYDRAEKMFYNLSNSKWAGLTVIGAGNWTINNLTHASVGVKNMFYNCGTLDIDLTNFDFTGVSSVGAFLTGNTKLTTARYDAALVAWDNSGVQNIVNLRMNSSQYTAGSAAETAKNNLINNKGWSITDGGPV